MFLLCFYSWPYILNNDKFSIIRFNIFSRTVHAFCNLFWKIFRLFGQILITCLKCSRASSSPSYYSEKMRWGRGIEINAHNEVKLKIKNYWKFDGKWYYFELEGQTYFNPFFPNKFFSYPLKTWENLMVSSCVQEVRECRIGNNKVQSRATSEDLFHDIPLRLWRKQDLLAANNDNQAHYYSRSHYLQYTLNEDSFYFDCYPTWQENMDKQVTKAYTLRKHFDAVLVLLCRVNSHNGIQKSA